MRFSTSRERAIQIKTHQPLQKRERSSTSMVFSSIPAYLDPANWQQQQQPNHHQNHETGGGNAPNDPNPLQLITSPPSSSSHHHQHQHVGGGAAAAAAGMLGSSIRPGSMAERARLANIPLPEAALKCPRCESTNTKFCYFNNYSLTQPRHFCKTCRRYWTRGGALRNVPVGGGCRRNKRSSSSSNKSSNSSNNNKSPVSSSQTHNNNSSSTSSTATVSPTANILGLLNTQQIAPLRFLSPLSQLSQHDQYNTTSNTNPVSGGGGGGDIISLNYNGISGAPAASLLGSTSTHEMNFHNQLGSNNFLGLGGGYNSLLSSNTSSIEQQWRLPFPNLLGGLDSSSLYHHFQGGSTTTTTSNVEPSSGGATFGGGSTEMSHDDQVRPSNYKLSSSMLTQMASIKMEDMNHHHHHHHHELNLSRQLMGNIPSNNTDDNQWTTGGAAGTAAWTDLSSFSSSSTSNPL